MSDKRILGIYGAGGFGKEVLSLIASAETNLDPCDYDVCFIDDQSISDVGGVQVLSREEFFRTSSKFHGFVLAISDPHQRMILSHEMEIRGGVPLPIVARSAVWIGRSEYGRGSIIFPGSVISNETVIGDFTIINAQCYVGHDVKIGDYVTISPGATICGNVIVSNQSFIGAGASILPGSASKKLSIGSNTVIGLGATVISDVQNNTVVVGNPARRIRENSNPGNE